MASIQGEGQTKFTIKVDHKEVDEAVSKLKQLDSTVKNIKSMASDIRFHFDMGSLKTFDVKKLKNFSDFFQDLRDPRLSSFDTIAQSFQGYNEQLAAFGENLKTIKTGKTIDLKVTGMNDLKSLKDVFGESLFENTKTKVDPNDKLSKNYLDNLKKNLTNKDQVKEFDSLVKDYNEQLKYYENESEFVKSGNSTIRKNTLKAIEDYKTGKETLEKAITEAVQFDSDWQKRLLKEDANFDLSTRLDLDNDDSRNFETLFDNINFKFEKYYESIAKLEKIQSSTDNGKLLGKIFGKDKEKIDEVQSIFNGIDDNKKWLFDYSKGLKNDGEKYSELTRKAFDAYINQDYFGDGYYNNLFKDEEFKDELESKYTYNDDKTLMGFKRKLNKSKKKLKEYINDNFTESQQNKADAEDINTKDVTIKVNFVIGQQSLDAVNNYINDYSKKPIRKFVKLELDKGQQGDGTDSINSTLSEFIDSQIKRMEVAGNTLTGIQKKFVDNKDSFALTVEDQNSPAVKRKNTETVYSDLLKDNEEYQRIKSEIKEITDIYGEEPKFVPDKTPTRFEALKKIAEDLIAPASTKGLKPEDIEKQTVAQAKQIFSVLGTNAKEYLETRSGTIHDLIQKFGEGKGKEFRVTNKKTGQMQDVSEDDFYAMLTNRVNDILESKAYQDSFVGGKVTGKANKYGISSKSGWLKEIKGLDKKISASDRKKEVTDSAQAAEEAKERYNQLVTLQKKIQDETYATAKADVEKMTLENPISQINNLVGEKQTVNIEVKVNPEDPFASLRQAISSIEGKPVIIQVESKPIKEAELQAAGKQKAESVPQEEVQTEPTPVDIVFKPVEGSAETLHSEIQSYFSGNPITVSFKPESVSKENVGEQVAESVKDDVEESITETVKVPTASWMKAYAAERTSAIEALRKDSISDIKFPSLKQNLEEMFYGPSKQSYADKSVRDFYSGSFVEDIGNLYNAMRYGTGNYGKDGASYSLPEPIYNNLVRILESVSSISGSKTAGILKGKLPDELAKFTNVYSDELSKLYSNREKGSSIEDELLTDIKNAFELVHNSDNYKNALNLPDSEKMGKVMPYGFHKNYPNYERLKVNNATYKKNVKVNDEAYEQAYQQWQESKEQVIDDFARETGFFADVDKNVERRMAIWERENPPQYTEKQVQTSKPKQQSKPKETKQTEKPNDLLSELQSQVDNAKPIELSVIYKPADNALSDLTSSAEGGEPISVPVKFKAAEDASGELQSALDGYSDLRVKVRFEPADDASSTLQSQLDGYADLKAKVRLEPSEDAANLLQTNLDGLTPVPVKVELKPVDNALQSVAEQYGESDAVPIPVSFKSAKQSKEETEVPSDHETIPVPVTFEPTPGAVDNLISQVKSAGPAKMEVEFVEQSGSLENLRSQVEGTPAKLSVEVELEPATLEAEKAKFSETEPFKIKIDTELNDSSLSQVKSDVESVENTKIKIDVDLNDSSLSELKSSIEGNESLKLKVDLEILEGAFEKIKGEVEGAAPPKMHVELETTAGAIEAVKSKVDGQNAGTATVEYTPDSGSEQSVRGQIENTPANLTVNYVPDTNSFNTVRKLVESATPAKYKVTPILDDKFDFGDFNKQIRDALDGTSATKRKEIEENIDKKAQKASQRAYDRVLKSKDADIEKLNQELAEVNVYGDSQSELGSSLIQSALTHATNLTNTSLEGYERFRSLILRALGDQTKDFIENGQSSRWDDIVKQLDNKIPFGSSKDGNFMSGEMAAKAIQSHFKRILDLNGKVPEDSQIDVFNEKNFGVVGEIKQKIAELTAKAKMEAEQASKTAYDNSVSQQRRILEESGKFDTASNPAGWTPKVYEDVVNAFSTPVPITFNYAEELAKIRSVIEEACSNIPITFDDSALNTSLSDTVEKLGKESLTESLSKLLTKEMMAEAKKQSDKVAKEKLKEEKAQKKTEEKAAKEAENKRLEDEQIQRMAETLKAKERTENEKPEKAEPSEKVSASAEALESAATSVNEAASSMEAAANAVTEKEKVAETKPAETAVKSEPEHSKVVEAKPAEVTSTPAVDISNAGTVNVNASNVKGDSQSTVSAIDNLSKDEKRRLYYDHLSNLLQERFGNDTKVSVKENGVYVYDKTLNDDNSKTESVRIYSGDLSRLTDTATGKLVDNIGDLILTEKWNKSPQSTAEKNRRAKEAREAEIASGGGARKKEKIRPDVASILNDLKALEGINPSSILFGDDRLNFSVTREENGAVQEHKYYIPNLSNYLTKQGELLEHTLLEGDGWPYSTVIKAFTEAPLETTPIFRNLITDESMSTNEMRMMAAQLVAENMPGILKDSIKFGNGFKLDFESAVLDQNGQWAIFKNQIADLRQILQSHAEGTLNNDLMPALLTSSEFTGFRNAPESTRAMSQYLADLPNGEQLLIAAQNYLNAVETLKQAEAALGQYETKEDIADDAVDRAIDRIDNQRKVVEKAKEAMDSQVNSLPEEEKGKAQNYLGQVLKGRAKSGALNAQQMASLSKNMSDFAEMYNFAMDESNFTGDYYTTAWNSKFDSKTKMTRRQAIAKLAEEYSQISNDLMENLYVTDEDRAFAKTRLKELKDRMTQGILNDPSKVKETSNFLQDVAQEEAQNEREIRQKVRDYYKQYDDASNIRVGRIKDGKVSVNMRKNNEYVEKLVSTQNLTNEKGQDVLRMEEIGSSSERWQSGWEKWGHSIAGKLKTLGAYFGGLRLIQAGMNEISSGFEFVKTMDSALTNINMTMGVSKKELSQLGQQAIKTGIDLSTDATNVIQAATIYANANETADSVLEKAKPTVLLSNASGVDASTSAQQIQAVVQQFEDLKGQETRIVNSYEKISAGLAIDFADGINIMAEAVQNAGSIADASGLSFETFAAITGKVSEKTRQEGTVIGNAMKSMMARISRSKSADEDVSDEDRSNAAKAYGSIGIQLYNDKGEYQNLGTTLDMLSSKWNTLTDAQKNYIAEQSAGTRGINTFNAMMETYAEAKELAKQAVDDSTFYEGVQKTWEGSVAGHEQKIEAQKEQLYSSLLDSGMLETGMGLLNGILDVINMIAGAASTINDFLFGWNDSLSKAVTSFGSLLTTLTAFDIGKALIKGDDRSFAINMLAAIKNGISPNGPNAGGEWFGGFKNYMSKGPSGILEDVKNTRLGKILTPDYKKRAKQEAETAAIEAETAKTEAKTATLKAETAQKESTVISQPAVTKPENNIVTTPEPKTEVQKPNVEAPMPAVNVKANKQAIKATEEVAESAVKAAEETSALSTAVDSVANVSAGAAMGASKIAEAGAEVASTAGAAAKSGGKLAALGAGVKNFFAAAWPMLAIAGVSAGVSWYLNKKKQDKETINNYASDSNSNIQSFLSGKSEVQSLIQEYTALSKGVDTLTGKNISLTNDEFERYLSLTSQIAERFPSLVDGFDASGNAILRYGTTVSGLNDEIEKSGLETAKNNLKSESLVLQQAENTFKRFSLDRTYDINNDADGTPNVDYSTYQKYLNIKEGMKGLDYSNLNKWFKDNQYASWVKNNYKLDENSSKKAFDSAVQQMKKDMAGYYSDMATDMNNYRSVLVNEAMLERYSNPSIKGLINNDTWDSLTSFLSKASVEQLSEISTNNISPEDFIKGITDAMTKGPNAMQTRDAFDALFSLNGSSSLSDLSQFMTKNAKYLKDINGFNLEGALSSFGQDNVEKRLKMAEKDFKDFQNHQVKTALATKPREGKADGSDAKEIKNLNKAYKDLTNASKSAKTDSLYKNANDYLKKTGKELKNQVNNLSDWNKLLSKLGVTTEADLEKLHDQLKKYNYDLDAMVDKWNTDTYDFNREEERIASLVSQAETIGNAFKYMHDAYAQSNTVNGLTPEWVKSIDNMFSELEEYNYDDFWESTTMGIRANGEEFTKCMAAWRRLKEEGYEAEVRRLSDAYADLARQIANAGTESEKAALSKELLQTKDQLDRAIEAKSLFYGQTNEAARWQMAYSSKSEKGNLFASLTGDNGGYASAEKLYKGHDIGTQEFRSFVDLISYDDYSDADVTSLVKKYESSKAALNRWLVEDTSAGIENFLEDMQRANPGLARLEGDQWKINTGGYSFDEIAKMMDMSTPFLQMISDAMSDKGFHVPINDVSDDLYEIRDKAKSGAEKIRQSIESQTGQPFELNFDYGTDKLEDVEAQLNKLHELGELHPELKDGDLKEAYDDLEDYFLTKKGEIEAEAWTPEGLKESTEKGLKAFKEKYKKNLSSYFDPEFSSDLESYYDEQIRQMREATDAGGKVLINDKNYTDQRNAVEAIIDSKLNSSDGYGWVSNDIYKNSTAKIAQNLSNASKQFEKVNLLNDIVELDPSEMSKAQRTLNKQISDLFAPENATALNQLRDAGNFNIEDLLPKDTELRNSLDSLYNSVKDSWLFRNQFELGKGFDKTDMLGAILGSNKKEVEELLENYGGQEGLNADLFNNLYKALGLNENNSGITAQGKNVQAQVKPVVKTDKAAIKKMQEDLNKSLKVGDGLNIAADIEITDGSLKKACEKTKDFAGANEQIVSEIIADPTRYQGAGKNEQIAYVKFLADQSSIQEVCKEVENSNPEAVAHIVADPSQYENYKPEDQQAYVKILAKSEDIHRVCSEIEGSNPEVVAQVVADPASVNEMENISIPDLQATVEYLSDMGALEEPEDAVAFVNYMLGQVQEPVDEVTVAAIAQILGVDLAIGEDGGVYVPAHATIENVDTSPVEGTTPPEATGGTAEYTTPDFSAIQGTIPPALTGGTAHYTSRSCNYDMTAPTIYGKAVYTKVGPGGVNGTAHAEGNAKPSLFQRIKAKIGGAFAGGNWGAPKTETALVGELGPELIVRGSKWFTVGDKGAEFANIRQGDIIFNHRQTEELFKNGYVTSNTGRGNLVGGAFAEGTAYNNSNNRWGEGSGGSLRVTQYSQNQAAQQTAAAATAAQKSVASAAQQAADETKETIDWIEVLISRIERVIDVLDTKASSAFRKWGDRMDDLGEQFAKVTEEIEIQRRAYEQYCAKAASLGLDETYAKKVRDGEMSIEDLMVKVNQNAKTDEEKKTLKDIIDEYQNWFI